MIEIACVVLGVLILLGTMFRSAYEAGYRDAKERYDAGVVRYDLTK